MLVIQKVCSISYRDYLYLAGSRKGYVDTYFEVKDKGEGGRGKGAKDGIDIKECGGQSQLCWGWLNYI